jgi:hypothetical protein
MRVFYELDAQFAKAAGCLICVFALAKGRNCESLSKSLICCLREFILCDVAQYLELINFFIESV